MVTGLLLAYGGMTTPVTAPEIEAQDFCVVAPPLPYDPKSGLGIHAPRPIPADARCPVCGMFPARAPDWAAQAIFNNGDTQFFDSPLTLFLYLQDVGRYTTGRQASEIAVSYVQDAAGSGWIRAADAYYVHGSNAPGPMRAGNLPPFASASTAQRFTSLRGGKVLRATQITPQLLHTLMAPRRHAHTGPVN